MSLQRAANYAKALFYLGLPENKVKDALQLLIDSNELRNAFNNPAIKRWEKEAIIDRLFDNQVRNFIKVLSVEQSIDLATDILGEFDTLCLTSQNKVRAKLSFVTELNDSELEQMKDMICKKYNKAGVELELQKDASLIGGFCLTVGGTEYDRSMKGTLNELKKTLARR